MTRSHRTGLSSATGTATISRCLALRSAVRWPLWSSPCRVSCRSKRSRRQFGDSGSVRLIGQCASRLQHISHISRFLIPAVCFRWRVCVCASRSLKWISPGISITAAPHQSGHALPLHRGGRHGLCHVPRVTITYTGEVECLRTRNTAERTRARGTADAYRFRCKASAASECQGIGTGRLPLNFVAWGSGLAPRQFEGNFMLPFSLHLEPRPTATRIPA